MNAKRTSRRGFLTGLTALGVAGSGVSAAEPRSRYRIERLDLYVRVTPPGRLAVAIGKNTGPRPAPERNPIAHVRMVVSDADGNKTYGCSGDRLSVRWLDKRPGRDKRQKLTELVELCEQGREIYLANGDFDDPFAMWLGCYRQIYRHGNRMNQEDLTSAFVSALFERAMLDAVCRLAGEPIFNMVKHDRLGFDPGAIIPELREFRLHEYLPTGPLTRIHVRHTVGKVDPLTDADVAPADRLNDGLPQTLQQYVRVNGQTHFKLKASGDVAFDLARMKAIWTVLPHVERTLITIDANEAYANLSQLDQFLDGLATELPEFFARVAYIEQPLPRGLTLDKATAPDVRRIGRKKRLIIDEADGTLTAFDQARRIGYGGCSHKNCKGLFKSLLNLSLIEHQANQGESLLLSAEDLQNMPIVPLHQDFAAVALLGLSHCERNGHHFNRGLCMVSARERRLAEQFHSDMYRQRAGELFLDVRRGMVDVSSLQCPGFGVRFEPDWQTMEPMRRWLEAMSKI